MAAASRSILGDNGNDSFLTQLQGPVGAIYAAVQQLNSLERSQSATFADLESIGTRLRTSVREVQVIEVPLSRIAINAAVSACHLGAPGDPLNVVAGAIQTLQNDCASRSREAEAALISIGSATAALAGLHESASSSDGVLEVLDASAVNLRGTHESSSAAGSSVTLRAVHLCDGLRQARQNFTIGKHPAGSIFRPSRSRL
jgi:hypothetical protein